MGTLFTIAGSFVFFIFENAWAYDGLKASGIEKIQRRHSEMVERNISFKCTFDVFRDKKPSAVLFGFTTAGAHSPAAGVRWRALADRKPNES